MDLKQFRTNVTDLVNIHQDATDEDFHKLINSWLNEVSIAKVKAAATEVATQVKGGVHKVMDAIHHYHNK